MNYAARHIVHEIYSDVLFELARQARLTDPVLDDLEAVARVFEAEPDFLTLLTTGKIKEDETYAMLRRVFGGRVNDLTLDFLRVLARRNRLSYLFGIRERYGSLIDQLHDIQHLDITLARTPSDTQLETIRRDLAEAVGSEVKVSVHIDPEIVGGIVIRKGDTMIDNSVRSLLNRAVSAVVKRSKEKRQQQH